MSIKSSFFGICCLVCFSVSAQQSKIDSLEIVIAKNNSDLETVNAINLIAVEWIRKDVNKAKTYLWRAKTIIKTFPNDEALSSTYSNLVSLYKNTAQLDSSEFYLNRLRVLSENPKYRVNSKIQANYASTAGLYYKKSGKYKEALVFFKRSYDVAIAKGDLLSASGQAINIGNCYLGMSDYNEGLKYYIIALNGFEKLDNKAGQSFCFNNISECYTELKRYSEALVYLNKSIKLKKELGDKRGLANAEQNLGNVYKGLKEYDKALAHYNTALTINTEMEVFTEVTDNYFAIGQLYAEMGRSQEAISNLEKSKAVAIKIDDSVQIISAELEILAIKKSSEQQIVSENDAILNLKSLQEAGRKNQEAAGYKNMAEYYTNRKQYDKALEYTNLYHALTDSIKNYAIQAQFKSIEEQYNKTNNEKQIELLQKDKLLIDEKLKQQRFLVILSGVIFLFTGIGIWMFINRNKLRQKMKEVELRNQIAADLHDEVGSSLSSIFMLSKMAANTTPKNQQTILSKVSDNAHETMDKMNDIVWMLKPSENYGIGLKERMERFMHDLCTIRNIYYSFQANELGNLRLTPTQSKNVYLIFKEAVNNAIKYSNTKSLDVTIEITNKKLNMVICDEGSGFDLKTIEKGNGLNNMTSRAIELQGKLLIDTSPHMGTRVALSFPMG
ncbi:histidine kinase-like protein [Ulvibacter sp. MAR_2010_11]|uniref:tetratricopeptide repeat-containing sensor histidine kinase n=1 Tax=Ulvibacter sp. MAR_2010_11 TaxID=1250229 RepID=UPI000C2B84BA|nr:tetratricopeptide repeat protein [Ulvibacter sp. MAR_2010_11]PKA84457.1 histidine kinase-like protein [Ulvibacter sp. MAR_2010_11]